MNIREYIDRLNGLGIRLDIGPEGLVIYSDQQEISKDLLDEIKLFIDAHPKEVFLFDFNVGECAVDLYYRE